MKNARSICVRLKSHSVADGASNEFWTSIGGAEGWREGVAQWLERQGIFLFLVPGSTFQVSRPPLLGIYPEGTAINYRPHIDMKDAEGKVVPWLASQTDLLADDWGVV